VARLSFATRAQALLRNMFTAYAPRVAPSVAASRVHLAAVAPIRPHALVHLQRLSLQHYSGASDLGYEAPWCTELSADGGCFRSEPPCGLQRCCGGCSTSRA
jgi:hypothetical protein